MRDNRQSLLLRVNRSEIIIPAIFTGLIAVLFVSKRGPLLAYMDVSGYIGAGLALFLTFKIANALERRLRDTALYSTYNWFKTIGGIVVWACLFYGYLLVSNSAIEILSGQPDYVLYPCSNPPQTAEELRDAKKFWKLRAVDDFDCEMEWSNENME